MAKGCLGIELGSARIKIAEFNNGSLVQFMSADMPSGVVQAGNIVSYDAVGSQLRDMLNERKIKTKQVRLVIPDQQVYIRRVTLPAMTVGQLEVNLPYEFHDFVGEDKDSYIYDYAVVDLHENEEGNIESMDLIGVCASKQLMDDYTRMCRENGMKLVSAMPQCFALSGVMPHVNQEISEKDYAIVDLGASATRIHFYSGGIFDTSRSIERGCSCLASIVAELMGCDDHIASMHMEKNTNNVMNSDAMVDAYGTIAVDILRAVNYYIYEKRDTTLDTLYVTGGGSGCQRLLEELANTLPVEVKTLASLSERSDEQEALADGASAAGIGWKEEE